MRLREERSRRRWQGGFWWHLIGAPIDASEPTATLLEALWTLVRGASDEPRPPAREIGRRYVDVLTDNFGQPGFHEVLLAVHDLDGRRRSGGRGAGRAGSGGARGPPAP